jgi:hypothetical protein
MLLAFAADAKYVSWANNACREKLCSRRRHLYIVSTPALHHQEEKPAYSNLYYPHRTSPSMRSL